MKLTIIQIKGCVTELLLGQHILSKSELSRYQLVDAM